MQNRILKLICYIKENFSFLRLLFVELFYSHTRTDHFLKFNAYFFLDSKDFKTYLLKFAIPFLTTNEKVKMLSLHYPSI